MSKRSSSNTLSPDMAAAVRRLASMSPARREQEWAKAREERMRIEAFLSVFAPGTVVGTPPADEPAPSSAPRHKKKRGRKR